MRSTKIIKNCSSSLCTCLHHMVILRTRNKITDFSITLAWASPFNRENLFNFTIQRVTFTKSLIWLSKYYGWVMVRRIRSIPANTRHWPNQWCLKCFDVGPTLNNIGSMPRVCWDAIAKWVPLYHEETMTSDRAWAHLYSPPPWILL